MKGRPFSVFHTPFQPFAYREITPTEIKLYKYLRQCGKSDIGKIAHLSNKIQDEKTKLLQSGKRVFNNKINPKSFMEKMICSH